MIPALMNVFRRPSVSRVCFFAWGLTTFWATSLQAQENGAKDLTLVAGGDVAYPSDWIDQAFAERGAGLFSQVRPLVERADLAFINLETPLTRRPPQLKKTYPIVTPPERFDWLLGAGFNLFSLANNHTYDAGMPGLLDTLDLLEGHRSRGAAIWWTGAAREKADVWEAEWVRVPGKDLLVAFLAFGSADTAHVPQPHDPRALSAIRWARERADIVIVSAHAGREYRHVPSAAKAQLFRSYVDAGADIVLGHHPHVIQGVEAYRGAAIVHSLGNFSFASRTIRHHATGARLFGMLPIIEIEKGAVRRVVVVPLYVNNRETWRLGEEEVRPDPCAPQVLTGVFARHVIRSLATWTADVPGISAQAVQAFRIEDERAVIEIPPEATDPLGRRR